MGFRRCLARALSSMLEPSLRSSVRSVEESGAVGVVVHSLEVAHRSHTISLLFPPSYSLAKHPMSATLA